MKITKEHYAILESEINKVLEAHHSARDEIVKRYESGDFPKSESVKDLQKRFCFDLLYAAGLNRFVCDHLYVYLNDDHIYTALKRICPTVNPNYPR